MKMTDRRSRWARVASLSTAVVVSGAAMSSHAAAVVGSFVDDGAYSFAVKIHIGEGQRTCSGALVDPQWILTAASCFADNPQEGFVIPAGAPKMKAVVTQTGGSLDKLTEEFHSSRVLELVPAQGRDLVMARLSPINWAAPGSTTNGVRPAFRDAAPIQVATAPPVEGEALRAAGYGRTKDEWVPDRAHTGSFVVGAVAGDSFGIDKKAGSEAGLCKGDAGAPVFREKDGKVELVGINSRSWQGGCFGESETRTGAVESRLDDVSKWIQKTRLPARPPALSAVTTTGDFNRDGRTDVAAVLDDGALHVYYGNADGALEYGRLLWAYDGSWSSAKRIIGGDFNGDGLSDIAAVAADGKLRLYQGRPNGSLAEGRQMWPDNSWSTMLQVARYKSDTSGRDGLIAVWGDGSLYSYATNTDGTLSGQKRQMWRDSTWKPVKQIASGDFNGDGRDDLAAITSDGGLRGYHGNAQGLLNEGVSIWGDKSWSNANVLMSGDVNGDGKSDLVGLWTGSQALRLYKGNGMSVFADGVSLWSQPS
ncbi:FG-GAP-like repeat-containing protein [Streptomyces sp. ERV7]|uniref:FG-GAP-like repeat-containing protein n=1 Tax=Streptomyces sp. ERV7 TaxID=1322334 RepID=UPI001F165D2C|nr:FG-GAP-like repeat-containing protein [Streptomyces sp. ERV7]